MSNQSSRGPVWETTRKRILQEHDYLCQYGFEGCTQEATEVDHITPKALGGTDEDYNLNAACKNCNVKKGTIVLQRANYLNSKWLKENN